MNFLHLSLLIEKSRRATGNTRLKELKTRSSLLESTSRRGSKGAMVSETTASRPESTLEDALGISQIGMEIPPFYSVRTLTPFLQLEERAE